MEIGWIEVLKKVYGQTIYTNMAQSILSKYYDLEIINVGLDRSKNISTQKFFIVFAGYREKKTFGSGTSIRSLRCLTMAQRGKILL